MNISFHLKKIKRNLNDYGAIQTLKKIILTLFKSIYISRSYYIYRRNVRKELIPGQIMPGIVFKNISKEDTLTIKQIEDMEEWLHNQLPHCLENGLCVVALDQDGIVAGFNLIAFSEVFIPLLNMKKKLRDKQAWSVQITVKKDYRRQGLAVSLRHHVFIELLKRGIDSFYGGTLVSNKPSVKLAQRAGFDFVALVRYRKIANRECRTYRRIKSGKL